MEIRQLKALARSQCAQIRFDARRLALIYGGVSLGASLVVSVISAILDSFVADTGGLGGMGTRAILTAAQMCSMLAIVVLMPFWNLGYTQAALDTARNADPRPGTLLEGFRRFLPALLLSVLGTAAVNVGSILYMLSPASLVQMTQLSQAMEGGLEITDPAVAMDIMKSFWPMYVLVFLALVAILVPAFYRLRLTEFSLVDGEEKALQNMMRSNYLMRGKCFWMFRLDLSFWWYFLLQALAALLGYGDQLFGGGKVAYWVFYLLSIAAQLALYWAFLPRVQTTYALAYEEITKDRTSQQNT